MRSPLSSRTNKRPTVVLPAAGTFNSVARGSDISVSVCSEEVCVPSMRILIAVAGARARRAPGNISVLSVPPRLTAGLCCLPTVLRYWHRTACEQTGDCLRVEPKFHENLLVVLSKCRGALCRHLGDAVHLNGAAD